MLFETSWVEGSTRSVESQGEFVRAKTNDWSDDKVRAAERDRASAGSRLPRTVAVPDTLHCRS